MVATLRREGFGVAAVSALFGIGFRTVYEIVRREEAEATQRRLRTAAQESEMLVLWRAGWSERELVAHFAISRDAVRAVLARGRASSSTSYGTE
jgi:hypothetical protein